MTKEIIIDSVDVSKCYRYQKKTGYCEGAFKPEELPFCENFDCDFKKLARAKEEIAELTSIINKSAKRFANDYLETFKENEKLKIQLMQKSEVDTFFNTPIEGWDNDACKICEYKQNYQAKEQECEKLKEKQKELLHDCNSCKFHQYKQALNKIEARIQLENADDCLLDIMEIIENTKES